MSVGEYLIIFSAILIGLAVADLSLSFHRLLRQGRSIQWHPISPMVGFLVLCFILNLWWGLFRDSQLEEITFLEFLPTVFLMLNMFLLSAAVFPDEKLKPGASMLEHYLDHRAQIWGLFALYFVIVSTITATADIRAGEELATILTRAFENCIGALLCLFLVWTRSMIAHWFVVGLGIVVVLLSWSETTLS